MVPATGGVARRRSPRPGNRRRPSLEPGAQGQFWMTALLAIAALAIGIWLLDRHTTDRIAGADDSALAAGMRLAQAPLDLRKLLGAAQSGAFAIESLAEPPTVDGFVAEWPAVEAATFQRAGRQGRSTFVTLELDTAAGLGVRPLRYSMTAVVDARAIRGDFALIAPGQFRLFGADEKPLPVRGAWQPVGRRARLELEFFGEPPPDQLQLRLQPTLDDGRNRPPLVLEFFSPIAVDRALARIFERPVAWQLVRPTGEVLFASAIDGQAVAPTARLHLPAGFASSSPVDLQVAVRPPGSRWASAGWLLIAMAVLLPLLGQWWSARRLAQIHHALASATRRRGVGRLDLATADRSVDDLPVPVQRLLDELDAHGEYLALLAARLRHELQTPLAISRTSLDNLAMLDPNRLDPSAQAALTRARGGIDRMDAIVRAMGSATRVERMLDDTHKVAVDLSAVVQALVQGYRSAASQRSFEADLEPGIRIRGDAELVAQALDKLVDNALDFAAADSAIRITLKQAAQQAYLSVENDGPRLPVGVGDRLFGPLVSIREDRLGRHDSGAPHLGFGLHISRLIALWHDGSLHAEDVAERGVRFELRFPVAP